MAAAMQTAPSPPSGAGAAHSASHGGPHSHQARAQQLQASPRTLAAYRQQLALHEQRYTQFQMQQQQAQPSPSSTATMLPPKQAAPSASGASSASTSAPAVSAPNTSTAPRGRAARLEQAAASAMEEKDDGGGLHSSRSRPQSGLQQHQPFASTEPIQPIQRTRNPYGTPLQRERERLRRALQRFHAAEEGAGSSHSRPRSATATSQATRGVVEAFARALPPTVTACGQQQRPSSSLTARPRACGFGVARPSTRPGSSTGLGGSRSSGGRPSSAAGLTTNGRTLAGPTSYPPRGVEPLPRVQDTGVPFWLPVSHREGTSLTTELLDDGHRALHARTSSADPSIRIHRQVERDARAVTIPTDKLVDAATAADEPRAPRTRDPEGPYSYDPARAAEHHAMQYPPPDAAHPAAFAAYLGREERAAHHLVHPSSAQHLDQGQLFPSTAPDGSLQWTALPPATMGAQEEDYGMPRHPDALPNLLGWIVSLHPERVAQRAAAERWRAKSERAALTSVSTATSMERSRPRSPTKQAPLAADPTSHTYTPQPPTHAPPSSLSRPFTPSHSHSHSQSQAAPSAPQTSRPSTGSAPSPPMSARPSSGSASVALAASVSPTRGRKPPPPITTSYALGSQEAYFASPANSRAQSTYAAPRAPATTTAADVDASAAATAAAAEAAGVPIWKANILASESRQREVLRAQQEWARKQQEEDDAEEAAAAAAATNSARVIRPSSRPFSAAAPAATHTSDVPPYPLSSPTGDPNSLLALIPSNVPHSDTLSFPAPYTVRRVEAAELSIEPRPNWSMLGGLPRTISPAKRAEAARRREERAAEAILFGVSLAPQPDAYEFRGTSAVNNGGRLAASLAERRKKRASRPRGSPLITADPEPEPKPKPVPTIADSLADSIAKTVAAAMATAAAVDAEDARSSEKTVEAPDASEASSLPITDSNEALPSSDDGIALVASAHSVSFEDATVPAASFENAASTQLPVDAEETSEAPEPESAAAVEAESAAVAIEDAVQSSLQESSDGPAHDDEATAPDAALTAEESPADEPSTTKDEPASDDATTSATTTTVLSDESHEIIAPVVENEPASPREEAAEQASESAPLDDTNQGHEPHSPLDAAPVVTAEAEQLESAAPVEEPSEQPEASSAESAPSIDPSPVFATEHVEAEQEEHEQEQESEPEQPSHVLGAHPEAQAAGELVADEVDSSAAGPQADDVEANATEHEVQPFPVVLPVAHLTVHTSDASAETLVVLPVETAAEEAEQE